MMTPIEQAGLFIILKSKNFQLFLCKLAKTKKGERIIISRYDKVFKMHYKLTIVLNHGHLRIFYKSSYGRDYIFGFDKSLTKIKLVYDDDKFFNVPTVFDTIVNYRYHLNSYDKALYEQVFRNECKNIYRYVGN